MPKTVSAIPTDAAPIAHLTMIVTRRETVPVYSNSYGSSIGAIIDDQLADWHRNPDNYGCDMQSLELELTPDMQKQLRENSF